ncbi:aminotransferase class III-fold pyridoxal phosphate-dependent enzyme [Gimesia aquarii]|uniref:3-aminobutyryl-CoA aminotransferase n=1 Tax=Gimesia aquarii TaxID=2527964 RepID=A0A517X0X9_9PLAN|nr:aminotransferase class III-fold pyridoxal phosphate-dependent enzyme [Gimesia aquarii]QDU11165.1 3-aminobutyryl-CoA aminotransferase [Gimesia aquarii]
MNASVSQAANEINPYVWATINDEDLKLFDQQLKSFVPPNSFDAHAHLWRTADLGTLTPPLAAAGPSEVTRAVYDERLSLWMPERCPTGGLFFPFPTRTLNVEAANQFLADQVKESPDSRGLMIVTPRQKPEAVEQQVVKDGFVGFKVYHLFAEREDTLFAPTEEFLPEWAWELAHRYELVIMLHMVLPRALAEPANQTYIRQHCERYPGAKLILAHAARGFCGRHTVEGISSLRGLENVYFDTSAVCEPEAFEAILKVFGPTRLLFGADFCVTEMRSRCVNLGDGFLWLDEIRPDFSHSRFAKPTLLGIESLLALKQACKNQHLTDGDVEEVFCLGARRLLKLPLTQNPPDVQAVYREAKEIFPGGTQLLSKRPEMFAPDQWPAYYREARGCEIIDIEGRHFIDMSLGGILACILGYSDPDVNSAVIRRVTLGSMATLQTADELELSKLLLKIHPWAQNARFTRAGGESMVVAVRIARAFTGRDKVAICGYHGWHDWYLAANLTVNENDQKQQIDHLTGHLLPGLEPRGVPTNLAGTALTFHYNKLDELDEIITKHGHELAAVVMEPTRKTDPDPNFLEGVRERCDRLDTPLIFDEISSGWRLCLGGAHRNYGVEPDLAVFAKALGNGFPIGAIIGTQAVMQAAQESFISSTFWTEGVGPAAAVACVKKQMEFDIPAHLAHIGSLAIEGWEKLGCKHKVPVNTGGHPAMAVLTFDHPEAAALTTLMTARMLNHGFLAGGAFNASLAHEPRHVEAYLAALDEVFAELATAIQDGEIRKRIGGPVKHTGFARLT